MTYMLLLNCALKLVEEIILYYDARSKKHQIPNTVDSTCAFRISGAATSGFSICSVFLVWYVKRAMRQFA